MTRDEDVAELVDQRLRHYAESGPEQLVPHPRLPLVGESRDRSVAPSVGCVIFALGLIYLGNVVDAAIELGDDALLVVARIAFGACLVGIPASFLLARRRSVDTFLEPGLARPWLDAREGMRLGIVEPANPAWREALDRAPRVQQLLRDRTSSRGRGTEDAVAEIRHEGAHIWATGEEWRRRQHTLPERRAVSPLDRLPDVLGGGLEAASVASDAASDAGTEAAGMGSHDADFAALARERAALYAAAGSSLSTCPDPALALPHSLARKRRSADAELVVFLASGAAAVALLVFDHPWWSLLACLPAPLAVASGMKRDLDEDNDVGLAQRLAIPWRDYLDAVAYVDSGQASVPTADAVRSCEMRVRALLLELSSETLSELDERVLLPELHRLCSQAWALQRQEDQQRSLLGRDPHSDS